jgi:hypothetical protein
MAGGGLRLYGDRETLRKTGKSRLELVPAGN